MQIQYEKNSDRLCFKSSDILDKESSVDFRFPVSLLWDLLEILYERRSKLEKIAIQPLWNLQWNATRQNRLKSFLRQRQHNQSRLMSKTFNSEIACNSEKN